MGQMEKSTFDMSDSKFTGLIQTQVHIYVIRNVVLFVFKNHVYFQSQWTFIYNLLIL